MTAETPEEGASHLVWIGRFQGLLLALGTFLWLCRSWRATLVFATAGAGSMAFWFMHRWVVGRMLTPSVRRRWFYAVLGLFKLALIVLLLRGMMACFPAEAVPLATGILLFVGGILLEALRLALIPSAREDG